MTVHSTGDLVVQLADDLVARLTDTNVARAFLGIDEAHNVLAELDHAHRLLLALDDLFDDDGEYRYTRLIHPVQDYLLSSGQMTSRQLMDDPSIGTGEALSAVLLAAGELRAARAHLT